MRKRNFDYNTPGAYFITICTHNKRCTLSRVGAIHESPVETNSHKTVGAIQESPANLDMQSDAFVGAIYFGEAEIQSPANLNVRLGISPAVHLLPYGKIIDDVITHIPDDYHAYVDCYVIMPNHIHLIVVVKDIEDVRAIEFRLRRNISPLCEHTNATEDEDARAIPESPLRERSALAKIIGYIKMKASKEIHKQFGDAVVWQRGFHDHIIRNRDDYEKIAKYIYENPIRWQYDCFYVSDEQAR